MSQYRGEFSRAGRAGLPCPFPYQGKRLRAGSGCRGGWLVVQDDDVRLLYEGRRPGRAGVRRRKEGGWVARSAMPMRASASRTRVSSAAVSASEKRWCGELLMATISRDGQLDAAASASCGDGRDTAGAGLGRQGVQVGAVEQDAARGGAQGWRRRSAAAWSCRCRWARRGRRSRRRRRARVTSAARARPWGVVYESDSARSVVMGAAFRAGACVRAASTGRTGRR